MASPEDVDFCKSLESLVVGTLRRLHDRKNVASAVEFLEGCVEGVPPSEGDAWRQHEAMVAAGMCREGERHKGKNRYRDGSGGVMDLGFAFVWEVCGTNHAT